MYITITLTAKLQMLSVNRKRITLRRLRQQGSSLIEILVTMLIVSLGLLGQAGVIALSAKASHSAFLRSQATLLSYDILERLRLNRAQAVAGNFTINYAPTGSTPSESVPSGSAIQHVELRNWKANLEKSLPNGDGQVTVDGGGNVTINIRWSEVVKGAADGTITPTVFTTQSVI
ncbi:type IV pilus modification protein PilV [Methylomonas sp. SURF-1]|uniref:Type IV pilus modification protein PilV n=1 Tax=Methylomonas aurea TaxID=2952224 RepID=A0ABT1UIU8_9GAMM|nr:type IV pilus modification protein PilV [Methylomonas sp. SURF-1]MCQ8181341.1 type IV pilus modification protein PilV [Methylomonas sp. SURF-1]